MAEALWGTSLIAIRNRGWSQRREYLHYTPARVDPRERVSFVIDVMMPQCQRTANYRNS